MKYRFRSFATVRIVVWAVFVAMLVFTLTGCGMAKGVANDVWNFSDWVETGTLRGWDHGGSWSPRG